MICVVESLNLGLTILIKADCKTICDYISMAGPWLKLPWTPAEHLQQLHDAIILLEIEKKK